MEMETRKMNARNVAISIGVVTVTVLLLFMVDEYLLQPASLQPNEGISLVNYSAETNKAHEMYRAWVVRYHQRTFEWTMRSTKVIFWVSIIVAISGISFAFWQFVEAAHKETKALEADELELKTQLVSVAFKSRSVAALVMFMSIAYLLIYIYFVYPITYLTQSPIDSRQGTIATSIEQKGKEGKVEKDTDRPVSETMSAPIRKEGPR